MSAVLTIQVLRIEPDRVEVAVLANGQPIGQYWIPLHNNRNAALAMMANGESVKAVVDHLIFSVMEPLISVYADQAATEADFKTLVESLELGL